MNYNEVINNLLIANADEIERVLSKYYICIKNIDGTFRPLIDILEELLEKCIKEEQEQKLNNMIDIKDIG